MYNIKHENHAAEFPCQFPETLVFQVPNTAANRLTKSIRTH